MKRVLRIMVSVFLVCSCISFSACTRITDVVINAKKNSNIDEKLPKYTLNQEDFKTITYNGKAYKLTENSFAVSDLDKPIGKISQRITVDENNKKLTKDELMKIYAVPSDDLDKKRIDMNFGWIYSVKGMDSDKVIAVVVNQNLRKAEEQSTEEQSTEHR